MTKRNQPLEYGIKLKLKSGATLEMLLFNHREHIWRFRNKFVSPEPGEESKKYTLVNDTTLVVGYQDGLVQNCHLKMNIVRPDKRGQKYFVGVDISEGSHLHAEFVYEKQGDLYRMKIVDLGSHGRVDLDSLGPGLVRPVDFPFPLKDCVTHEYGVYKNPFLKSSGEEAFFEFPKDYHRNNSKIFG